jgi:hypothetical protein
MKILLRHFNAKVGREDIFIHTIVYESLHAISPFRSGVEIYSTPDECRIMFARVCFAVLRSYFDHTALVGHVCTTNVFVDVFVPPPAIWKL